MAALAAAGVVATAGIAAPAGAGAAPTPGHAPAPLTPNPSSSDNELHGVSAVSGSDAWAVGSYIDDTTGVSKTLILHWNGRAWSKVRSPNPSSSFNELLGVSAVSGSDAWAVGDYTNGTAIAHATLVLHWNGMAWSKVKSPNPSPTSPPVDNSLNGVSAVSGNDAWAVGYYDNNAILNSLILHWNGTAWTRVDSPAAPFRDFPLHGVSAVSGSDAWAVGYYNVFGQYQSSTLILHWNGTAWTQVSSPSPGSGQNFLNGVSAVSGSDAWAVGSYNDMTTGVPSSLVLHWNGTAWTQLSSPSPSSNFIHLQGVSAVSGSDAWAVGYYQDDRILSFNTLILHWNGMAWTQVKSPNPSCPHYRWSYNYLYGMSARSGSDAWAVGDYGDCATAVNEADTLVAHWNGRAWANASAITTSTSVVSSANPVTTGSPVTYTATVAHITQDGGRVAFYDNGSLISSCRAQPLRPFSATCTVTYASAGSHTIKAAYSGFADYRRSTSPSLTETVKAPATASAPASSR